MNSFDWTSILGFGTKNGLITVGNVKSAPLGMMYDQMVSSKLRMVKTISQLAKEKLSIFVVRSLTTISVSGTNFTLSLYSLK